MASNASPEIPAFHGIVETTLHALRLIHAARQGTIPRITRRLNDSERRTMIKSGAVFIFSVTESGIKRWTDGLLWSPSRIHSNYLVYREINERTNSRGNNHRRSMEEPSVRGVHVNSNESRSRGLSLSTNHSSDIKRDGLIKKTITVCIDNTDLHLISYYTAADLRAGVLKTPSSREDIMKMHLAPHIFRGSNFRNPPKVEMGPDGKARFVPEDSPPPGKEEDHNSDTSPSNGWPSSDHLSQTHSPIEGPFARRSPPTITTSVTVPVARTVCSSYSRISAEGNGWPANYASTRLVRRHDSWAADNSTVAQQTSVRNSSGYSASSNTQTQDTTWSPGGHAGWQSSIGSLDATSGSSGVFNLDTLRGNSFVKRELVDDDSTATAGSPFNQRYVNQEQSARTPNWNTEEKTSAATNSFSSSSTTTTTASPAPTVDRFDYNRHSYDPSWSPNHTLDQLPHSPGSSSHSSGGGAYYQPSSSSYGTSRSSGIPRDEDDGQE